MSVRLVSVLVLSCLLGSPARADSPKSGKPKEVPKNLTVIAKDIEMTKLQSAMKKITTGLGAKCADCHVKGDSASDDLEAKVGSRKFLRAVVGNPDATTRKAALGELLVLLKLKAPRDEALLWTGVDALPKQ